MFFKKIDFSKYELTDQDTLRACFDELELLGYEILEKDELRVLAEYKAEKFKNFMRPLFGETPSTEILIKIGE